MALIPLVVNIWGAPGYGKTTLALNLAGKLKTLNYKVEYIAEMCKLKAWEKALTKEDQPIIFLNQAKAITKAIKARVPIIITDSPIMLSCIYHDRWSATLISEFEYSYLPEHKNLDILLNYRTKKHASHGRSQTEEESDAIQERINACLTVWNRSILIDSVTNLNVLNKEETSSLDQAFNVLTEYLEVG